MTAGQTSQNKTALNAEKILTYSRKALTGQLPELMPAFFLLKPELTDQPGSLRTDGSKLYYHAETVVQDYLQDKRSISMQLLHIVLHGLQGHFSKRKGQCGPLFDAMADAKTTYLMNRFGYGKRLPSNAASLVKSVCTLSLEAACAAPDQTAEAKKLCVDAQALRIDDHSGWLPPPKGNGGESEDFFTQWDDAAAQCARQLSKSPQWGDLAGSLSAVYREVEPSGVSYAAFLRRFLCTDEVAAVDPDSIDRIWYHVGLEQLGDIPIIEPDELREDSDRLSLAVALDTSGSCCGEVMKEFLSELMSILQSSPNLCVTLLQCDTKIRCVHQLTSEDDVEELFRSFKMYGGGGTDFRPVFSYLDKRYAHSEKAPLQGLLYLSDGYGSFPPKAPEYPVAFLLPQDNDIFCEPAIPDWVTKVTILEDNTLRIE